MPKNISGYFSDMILGDFDNNNQIELISSAYQDDKPESVAYDKLSVLLLLEISKLKEEIRELKEKV